MSTLQTPRRSRLWLLLDMPGAPDRAEELRRVYPQTQAYPLFEGAGLQRLSEQGPWLLDLEGSPLAAISQASPGIWTGLFMITEVSAQALLEHLRAMLVVRFGEYSKGVLSYYNPQTASYFFDATDTNELSSWLGPISLLYWYGGTWADKASGSLGWQQVANPCVSRHPLEPLTQLSIAQQGRLQTCLLERHAYYWSQAEQHGYQSVWRHLQEGLRQGFNDSGLLDAWLRLRLRFPMGPLPDSPPGLTPQQRLDWLRRAWEGDE